MKVFLSWSGDLSLKVACAFRDWLPSVLQSVKPYVLSEDLDKGSRWSTDIAKELEASSVGILCITRDNIDAPWINFEAGALSKTVDKARVAPFLVNIKRSEVNGPLLQFQSVIYEREDVGKLLSTINSALPAPEQLDDGRLKHVFQVWWPELKTQLDQLIAETPPLPSPTEQQTKNENTAILEELLELTRTQHKLLRSPEVLLPPNYLAHALQRYRVLPTPRNIRLTNLLASLRPRFVIFRKQLIDHVDKTKDITPATELVASFSQIEGIFERILDQELHATQILQRRIISEEEKEPPE